MQEPKTEPTVYAERTGAAAAAMMMVLLAKGKIVVVRIKAFDNGSDDDTLLLEKGISIIPVSVAD